MSAKSIQSAAKIAVDHLIATGEIAHAHAIKRLITSRIISASTTSSLSKDIRVYRALLHRARDVMTSSGNEGVNDDEWNWVISTINAALASSAPGKILPDATTAGQDNA